MSLPRLKEIPFSLCPYMLNNDLCPLCPKHLQVRNPKRGKNNFDKALRTCWITSTCPPVFVTLPKGDFPFGKAKMAGLGPAVGKLQTRKAMIVRRTQPLCTARAGFARKTSDNSLGRKSSTTGPHDITKDSSRPHFLNQIPSK